jgi:D-3-phosphoglycerate dehydrogenase
MAPRSEGHASCSLVVRHLDKVGVLAGLLDRLRDEGINIEQMENKIFRGARAAVCYVILSRRPSDKTLVAFSDDPDIINAAIVET